MCLITYQQEPKILEEDLIVYKIVEVRRGFNTCTSPFNYFKWTKNVLEHTEIVTTDELHGAFDSRADEAYPGHEYIPNTVYVLNGFHAATSIDRLTRKDNNLEEFRSSLSVERFKIPAGSKIFYDCTGLIVADNMVWIG
jgi:hypothetical protein